MYDLKIYLAGKMSGLTYQEMNEWRETLRVKLIELGRLRGYKVQAINPVTFYNYEHEFHQSEREIEDYDLAHVISSDVIIVNLDGLSSSDGTKLEIFEAYRHHKIPVIALGSKELYKQVHPWIQSKIMRVEETEEGLLGYIRDYYMI